MGPILIAYRSPYISPSKKRAFDNSSDVPCFGFLGPTPSRGAGVDADLPAQLPHLTPHAQVAAVRLGTGRGHGLRGDRLHIYG